MSSGPRKTESGVPVSSLRSRGCDRDQFLIELFENLERLYHRESEGVDAPELSARKSLYPINISVKLSSSENIAGSYRS